MTTRTRPHARSNPRQTRAVSTTRSAAFLTEYHETLAIWIADKILPHTQAPIPVLRVFEGKETVLVCSGTACAKERASGTSRQNARQYMWGGIWRPYAEMRDGAIDLYPSGDLALDRGVVAHELSHWARHHTGDRVGQHDSAFYALAARVYQHGGVTVAVARSVEVLGAPKLWTKHEWWGAIVGASSPSR